MLGFKILSIDAEAGTMETEFEATPQFLNAGGTVQGGFITALLDDTVSYAGVVHLKGTHTLPNIGD
jgi:acyl-coenzyme A thioesterase PaaI-like protein